MIGTQCFKFPTQALVLVSQAEKISTSILSLSKTDSFSLPGVIFRQKIYTFLKVPTNGDYCPNGQLISKEFLVPLILPKNEQNQVHLMYHSTVGRIVLFVFWKSSEYQQVLSKLTDL